MAYNQKNNPFKKTTDPSGDGGKEYKFNTRFVTNPEDIDLAKRLNKLRFNMGHIYPITSEEEIREKNPHLKEKSVQNRLRRTAQTEKERSELYAISPTGSSTNYPAEHPANYKKDLAFIKSAREAGGDVFNKVMSMPEQDIVNLEQDVIATAQPFRGKNLGKNTTATLKELAKLDLSRFKPYLEKSGLEVNDISKIITSQLNNLPDLNKDGTPDAFEGIKGKILKKGIDYLVSSKLDHLR
jgi:hypothetical protein|tara:strand:- start:164 stop:883 length:720 start_codon:yes stop_codon:yes gene_type:complete